MAWGWVQLISELYQSDERQRERNRARRRREKDEAAAAVKEQKLEATAKEQKLAQEKEKTRVRERESRKASRGQSGYGGTILTTGIPEDSDVTKRRKLGVG